jgi:hypothetical protein
MSGHPRAALACPAPGRPSAAGGHATAAFRSSRLVRRTVPPPFWESKLAVSVKAFISAIPRPFSAVSSGQVAR